MNMNPSEENIGDRTLRNGEQYKRTTHTRHVNVAALVSMMVLALVVLGVFAFMVYSLMTPDLPSIVTH